MAKIPYPDINSVPEKVRKLIEGENSLNIFKTMAHTGNIARAFARFGFELNGKGELDHVLREIAILRVGFLSSASYEVYHHKNIGKSLGMTDEKLSAIEKDINSSLFTDLEKQVLLITDQIVNNVKAEDKCFDAISEELSDREVMELVIVIGFYMMVCRFLENYEVEIENSN